MTTSEEGAPGDNADVAEGTCDDRLACDGRVPGRNDAGKNYNAGRSNEYYFYTRAPSRGPRDRPLGCGLHKPRRISSSFFFTNPAQLATCSRLEDSHRVPLAVIFTKSCFFYSNFGGHNSREASRITGVWPRLKQVMIYIISSYPDFLLLVLELSGFAHSPKCVRRMHTL